MEKQNRTNGPPRRARVPARVTRHTRLASARVRVARHAQAHGRPVGLERATRERRVTGGGSAVARGWSMDEVPCYLVWQFTHYSKRRCDRNRGFEPSQRNFCFRQRNWPFSLRAAARRGLISLRFLFPADFPCLSQRADFYSLISKAKPLTVYGFVAAATAPPRWQLSPFLAPPQHEDARCDSVSRGRPSSCTAFSDRIGSAFDWAALQPPATACGSVGASAGTAGSPCRARVL